VRPTATSPTGELDIRQSREFVLALSFGDSLHHALVTMAQALGTSFTSQRTRFVEQWRRAGSHLLPLKEGTAGDGGRLYRVSHSALLTTADTAGGHERPSGDLSLHSRQHRHGGGRTDPSAGGATAELIATGSEVHLALNAQDRLTGEGVETQVVSLPCSSLFRAQPAAYRDQVLPEGVPVFAIEAGVTLGWDTYVGPPMAVVGVDHFGASAPGETVMREYGFPVGDVCRRVRAAHGKERVSER
jgi:transketolase-like protein/glucodextranase-like protein